MTAIPDMRVMQTQWTALIVDDHPIVRLGLQKLIESYRIAKSVDCAESGEEALQKIKEHQPDVVLMDVHMEGIGGIEAMRRISRLRLEKRPAVIAVSSLNGLSMVQDIVGLGVRAYLHKSAELEEVRKAIAHACTSKPSDPPYLSSALAQESASLSITGKSSDPMKALGKRERQVLLMAASGMTNQEIAATIFIAQKTVENHKSSALKKLAMTMPEFAIWAKDNSYLG